MRKLFTLVAEGFFILLPVLIAYLMFGQLFDGLLMLSQPLVDVLPLATRLSEPVERLLATALLIVIFLVVGLIGHTRVAARIGAWFEENLLNRFPPYSVVKSLTTRLAGKDSPASLQPGLLTTAEGSRMLVAVVEELPDGLVTVFIPLAPTPGVGLLQIVSSSKVERLDSSMGDALGWILNWGVGTEKLLRPTQSHP